MSCISNPLRIALFSLAILGLPHLALADPPSLRTLTTQADIIVRIRSLNAVTEASPKIESAVLIAENLKGALLIGEETKLGTPADATSLPDTLPFRGQLPKLRGEEVIVFGRIAEGTLVPQALMSNFTDWTLDASTLIHRYVDLTTVSEADAARALSTLLVRVITGDPRLGDPYGVGKLLLSDWRTVRAALGKPHDDLQALFSLAAADIICSVRFAARGTQLGIALALSPLLLEAERREVVQELLTVTSTPAPEGAGAIALAIDGPVAKLRERLPLILSSIIHPEQTNLKADPAILTEARAFARPAREGLPATLEEWVERIRNRRAGSTVATATAATATVIPTTPTAAPDTDGLGALWQLASDVVIAQKTSTKRIDDKEIANLRIFRWLKRGSTTQPEPLFIHIEVSDENRDIITHGFPAEDTAIVFFTSAEGEDSSLAITPGSTIEPRRLKLVGGPQSVIQATPERLGILQGLK